MRRRVVLVAIAAAVIAATAARVVEIRVRARGTLVTSEHGQLTTQIATLRAYAAGSRGEWLIPPTDAVVAIHEQFLRRVIAGSLPLRWSFSHGRYVARLDSADVRLAGGLALVTLAGRGMLAGHEDS